MGLYHSVPDFEHLNRIRKYTVQRDFHDYRDIMMDAEYCTDGPQNIDLTSLKIPVYDQGHLGSCTANGLSFAYEYDESQYSNFKPSRLFLYYGERELEGDVKVDAGASIRDGCKVLNISGVCGEEFWPYNIEKFSDRPPSYCYKNAGHHKCLDYRRVRQTEEEIIGCLQSGYPVVIGLGIYESFESIEVTMKGIVPKPEVSEKLMGGHCMCIVGCDSDKRMFLVRNSWGGEWGIKSPESHRGHCWIPYDYILDNDLTFDFWMIRTITD